MIWNRTYDEDVAELQVRIAVRFELENHMGEVQRANSTNSFGSGGPRAPL